MVSEVQWRIQDLVVGILKQLLYCGWGVFTPKTPLPSHPYRIPVFNVYIHFINICSAIEWNVHFFSGTENTVLVFFLNIF